MKRIVSAVLIAILCLSLCPVKIVSAASKEYNFTERIVYGGTAVDYGSYIYFANPDDEMFLYRRTAGKNDSVLIYPKPVGYLNILGERLYFISENRIISTSLFGTDEKILYTGDSIIDLYAAPECLYFLENHSVKKYKDGAVETIFTDEALCAFLPLSDSEFQCYKANPDYKEIDQTSDEMFEDCVEEFLTYIYNTKTTALKTYTPEQYEAAAGYTGPYITVGSVTLPLKEYMPGSFFSKNGKACTCHNRPEYDCVDSINGCNCMRYWPTGIASTCEIDLLGAQCFAFARFIFYRCFGFIDHNLYSSGKFYSVGSLSSGAVTANSVKELLMKTKTGAHVRLARGHSVSIFTMDDQYITVYHGNAGGDGVASQACVVSTKKYTWADFAAYAAKGISYANMPYDYPGNTDPQKKSEGYYTLTSNLNVRAGTGTTYKILGQISKGSVVKILQISNDWGRIEFNGSTNRWITLEYSDFESLPAIQPKKDSGMAVDNTAGYLLGINEKTSVLNFKQGLENSNLFIYDRDGNPLSDTAYIGTGCFVNMSVNQEVKDSKQVLVKGDVNGNGFIEVVDYLILKRTAIGNYTPESIYFEAADLNNDKKINSMDCYIMKRYLIGSINSIMSKSQE